MRLWPVLIAATFIAGCGTGGDGGQTTTSLPDASSSSSTQGPPDPGNTTSTTPKADMDIEAQAVADLAARLGVPEADIEVLTVEAVTWPDGSLGCPEEGKMYTQALVDGHRIVLGHDERLYVYHSGIDEPPFLCPSDEKDGGYGFLPPPGGP
jgi:hypothetical protein